MSPRQRITVVAAICLAACLGAAAGTVYRLDQVRPDATLRETLYIPSATVLKRMSLGYTGLLADIYWTRVVQYFGGHHHQGAMEYQLLEPLLDITTTLDPNLLAAYEFGGVFLAQQPPEGAGDPDAAVRLVERGIRCNPNAWRLYYSLGFIHYFERRDYKAAADAFQRGSQVPDAHPWMKIMAASMAHNGGDTQTARFLWSKIYESTDDQMIRANALKRLRALRVDDEVLYLERLVQAYSERHGHLPASWGDLIAAHQLRSVPLDPLGQPYNLMGDGRIEVQSPKDLPFIHYGLPSRKPSK